MRYIALIVLLLNHSILSIVILTIHVDVDGGRKGYRPVVIGRVAGEGRAYVVPS